MKSKYRNLLWLIPIAILVIAAVPSFTDFNTNQFGTTGNRVSIKTGVLVTNPVIRANGTLGTAGQALLSTGAGVGWSNVLSEGDIAWPVAGSNVVVTTNGLAVTVNALTDTNVVESLAVEAVDLSPYQLGDAGLTNFSVLADAAGRLTNNGAGVFGWDNSAMGIAGADVLTMINTNAVWTNDGTLFWLSDYPAPNTAGSLSTPFFYKQNGSMYIGTNVFQEIGDVTLRSQIDLVAAITMVRSNEPSALQYYWGSLSDENYDYWSQSFWRTDSGTNASVNDWSLGVGDGFGREATVRFYCSSTLGPILTMGNSSVRLTINTNGIIFPTASSNNFGSKLAVGGIHDSSLTEGSIVGVGANGRLINTNIVQMVENNTFTNVTITNLTVQNLTVNNSITVVSNISAKTVNVENIYVTNGTVLKEHTWTGATNQLYVGSTNRYTYTAYTPCAVTNLVRLISGFGNSALLSITNASASNITFTVHSPIRIPYGETTRTYTITNGDVFAGSFDYGTHGMLYVPRGFFSP